MMRLPVPAACLLAAMLAGTAHAAPAGPAHLPTPIELATLAQVSDPQIRPDGAQVAYAVTTPRPGHAADVRIWQVPFDGHASAQVLPAPADAHDSSPQWSSDGQRLLFLSDRPLPGGSDGLGHQQVWSVAGTGSAAQALTRAAGEVADFALSPDGATLAYLAADPPSAQELARQQALDDAVVAGRPGRLQRVWLRTLATGATRALTPADLQVHSLAWSPDGRTLALRVSAGATLNDYWYDSRVVLADAATGAIGSVLCPHASAHPLAFSPDGRRLLYGELGPHGMVATLYVQDLAAGTRVALGLDWPGTLWLARWRDDRTLVGEGQQGVRGALLDLDAATGRATVTARPQIPYQSFTVASDGRVAYLGIADRVPGEIWTARGASLRQRTEHHRQVAGWAHAQVQEVHWTASTDGRAIAGVLVTPPGWQAGRDAPLPTLVQVHGGPAWAWWSGWLGSWHDWAQLLATRGYAVFLPNPRGSEGQGHAFTELARGDWGGGDFQDVLDGVDQLQHQGVIDPARLAIGGWSYGGFLSAWAVGHSNRFKTAIVGAGVIDVGAMALTTDVPDYLPGYFGDPVAQRADYDAHSPIRSVERVKVPVLILHGQADQRVPWSQGQMFYRALKFQGTPVEMVSYPRGPHWFTEPTAGADVQQRVLDWLDSRLR